MSPQRWLSTRHLSRADWKLQSTWPAACMTSTSSQNTRNSGLVRSGVSRMRLHLHSRSWIPSHNSRRQPSWANSWKPGSHNRSSLRDRWAGCPVQQVIPLCLDDPRGRGSPAWAAERSHRNVSIVPTWASTRCRLRLEALRGRSWETPSGVALAIRRYSIELGLERNYRQVLGFKTKVRCAEGRSQPPKLGHY